MSGIALCQESSKVLVEKKKLDRLLDIYFFDYPACQRSIMALDSLNSILKTSLAYSDSLNQIKAVKIELQASQLHLWSLRHENTIQANKEAINDLKKKKNRITLIAIGEAVLLVLLVL